MRVDQDPSVDEQQPVKQSFCRSLRRDTHWKCLILSLLITGCLVAISWCRLTVITQVVTLYDMPFHRTSRASPCEDGYVYIPVAFVVMLYLVYLVECWHCHTRLELQCKVDVNTVYERIQSMKESIPVVWWKAVCYHYVRRTRQVTRYRNGDAFTTTQVYYERVNSHTATSCFNFTSCGIKDASKHLMKLEGYPATKIKFTKGFSFAAYDAEHEFEEQRAHFFQTHERMDDYMETREGLDLMNVNFKEYMIAFADPDNLPWYVSQIVFWTSSVFMLSWPLRVLIEYKTAYVHYHVHKVFGTNYADSSSCPGGGQMSRAITMESSELELNITNNYSMVPSYSEALLMECAQAPRQQFGPNGPHQIYGATTTPNGSIPLVHLGNSICLAPGTTSNYLLPNGTSGQTSGTTYQNVHANGYIPLGPGNLVSSRQSANFSSSDTVGSLQRRRRRRRRKRRPQSYMDAIQGPGDTETSRTRNRAQTPNTDTPDSLSDTETVTRDSSMDLIDSEGADLSSNGHGVASGGESRNGGHDNHILITIDDKSGSVLGETSRADCPSSSGTKPKPENPPAYELALAMSKAGLTAGVSGPVRKTPAVRPTSLPPTRSRVPAYQQERGATVAVIESRPEPPIRLMETSL